MSAEIADQIEIRSPNPLLVGPFSSATMPFRKKIKQGFKQLKGDATTFFSAKEPTKDAGPQWKCLADLARAISPAAELFGPINQVIGVFAECIDIFEMARVGQKKYDDLQVRLELLFEDLANHLGSGPPTMTESMESICKLILKELHSIKAKRDRTDWRRYLEARDEADEILDHYSKIASNLERLSLNANLSIWKIVDQHATAYRSDQMFFLVDRLPSSLSARYNSAEASNLKRRACTPDTRVDVLTRILEWASSNDEGTVFWLNGMAGTGKTTIAYSTCDRLNAEHKLAASFFCSRLREECRNVNLIFPSIAYQIARFSRPFMYALSEVLKQDPDAHSNLPRKQFEELIAKPLHQVKNTLPEGLVVVIDALDECDKYSNTIQDILDILLRDGPALPIKFVVSSRPEPEIRDQMTEDRVKPRLVLHELNKSKVQADIETYLRVELAQMKPSEEDISRLVKKAGMLFIYAATAARFIGYDNFQSHPVERLSVILGKVRSEGDGTESRDDGENEEIDQLYTTILRAALDDPRRLRVERDRMRQVLHVVICAREPLNIAGLSVLLKVNSVEDVRTALRPLWSVLHVTGEGELAVVTTLHASFPDFMFDANRSKTYYCDSKGQNRKLADQCFDCIARTQAEFNICGLESSHLPDESIPGIKGRVEKAISSELFYACRYWADHVEAGKCAASLTKRLFEFLSTRLLLWMEVLNLKGQMKAAMDCMKLTVEWSNQFEGYPELTELSRDASRFVEAFASNTVSQSTPHLYVSMMAFWPRSAPMVKHYARFTRGPVTAEGTGLDRRQLAHLSTWAFEAIDAMSVSWDGSYIGLGIDDDVVVVDSASGSEVLGPLKGHQDMVNSIAFSPDGARLFSGSYNFWSKHATILGWDTRTGETVLGPFRLDGHTDRINCLSLSPDGTRIATGSNDETVRLWNAKNGSILYCLAVESPSYGVVLSPDGTRVACVSGSTLYVWDSQTGDIILGPLTHTESILRIAFSPDNSRIIGGTYNGDANNIHVWDAQSGDTILGPIQAHTDYIRCIGCSPDGSYIVSGSADRTISVWDAHNGNMVLGPLEAHTGSVISVTFSPDSSRIISACQRGLVCTWDAQQRNITPHSINAGSDSISCVKFSSDGTRFVSGSPGGTISIWDAQTGEIKVGPIKAHTDRINAVDVLNDRVVSGSRDGTICICDALSGEVVLGPLKVASKMIRAVAYSPNSNLIATGSDDSVDVWDAQDGTQVLGPLTDLDGWVFSIQFSPDGTHLVGGSKGPGRRIVVWDVADGKNVFGSLDGHSKWVISVSYSPDGALIASGSHDSTIIVWNAYTGQKAVGPFSRYFSVVCSVNFSPDSTRLVSGSNSRTIRIWDVQTGEMMFELLHGHQHWIRSVEYSPDGTRIISCANDMTVRIHDARSPEERALSRSASEVGDWTMNKDGWVVDDQSKWVVWVPGDLRRALLWPRTLVVAPYGQVHLKYDKSRIGESWAQSFISHM
ncbi:hypothetical protein OPQ81_001757 [Rhizoctonia solani]|nr:hypothetical protein OPQ81_001757 [Rhizoctonia solani]